MMVATKPGDGAKRRSAGAQRHGLRNNLQNKDAAMTAIFGYAELQTNPVTRRHCGKSISLTNGRADAGKS